MKKNTYTYYIPGYSKEVRYGETSTVSIQTGRARGRFINTSDRGTNLEVSKREVGTGGCVKSAVSIQAIKEVRSRSEDEVLRVSSLYQYERMVVNVEMSESVRCINTSKW